MSIFLRQIKETARMFCHVRQKQGQFVGEYSVVLVIVIFAIAGMLFFMKRGFSARINDARAYMSETLDSEVDQAYQARGGHAAYSGVLYEYEPYYVQKTSDIEINSSQNVIFSGPQSNYLKEAGSTTRVNATSQEAGAKDDYWEWYQGGP